MTICCPIPRVVLLRQERNDKTIMVYSFSKELYSRTALLKAAYTFIDLAYVHLDADEQNWIVTIDLKDQTDSNAVSESDFVNEMLVQSLRHEVYEQTKNIREMLYARSVASSLVINDKEIDDSDIEDVETENEKEILHDWFEKR